ncbi:hypothetical protein BV97_01166 [Novosphingobium resinovorum]|uniref:Uncharacterized protein n=1 Tax=Novosphingobium resinovorum TaxID=158500 RepID=A0A031K4N1_9SPHN|nr:MULTISPECIES: hypothetical protein [Novosphingobium]EZP83973.1 hypothetical protein BV97_01166 [Novosphingobium resinovorum]
MTMLGDVSDPTKIFAAYLLPAPDAGAFQMCRLDRELAAQMARRLPAQTASCVMDTFGISINSWVKLRDDQPVRRSLAERLIARLHTSGMLAGTERDTALVD